MLYELFIRGKAALATYMKSVETAVTEVRSSWSWILSFYHVFGIMCVYIYMFSAEGSHRSLSVLELSGGLHLSLTQNAPGGGRDGCLPGEFSSLRSSLLLFRIQRV